MKSPTPGTFVSSENSTLFFQIVKFKLLRDKCILATYEKWELNKSWVKSCTLKPAKQLMWIYTVSVFRPFFFHFCLSMKKYALFRLHLFKSISALRPVSHWRQLSYVFKFLKSCYQKERFTLATNFVRLQVLKMEVEEVDAAVALIFRYRKKIWKRKRECWLHSILTTLSLNKRKTKKKGFRRFWVAFR